MTNIDFSKMIKIVPKSELSDKGWYLDTPGPGALFGKKYCISFCSSCDHQNIHGCVGTKILDGSFCYILMCKHCFCDLDHTKYTIESIKKVLR